MIECQDFSTNVLIVSSFTNSVLLFVIVFIHTNETRVLIAHNEVSAINT